MTPRQFAAAFEGARKRAEAEHNGRAWLAWHVAALDRQKRLPDLSRLQVHDHRPQTWQEQMAVCRAIAAAYGGLEK
jgi:hypothetical protein